ncbi:uncharacterized protein LOC142233350 [Haematobia irritans]|uniref:uncharacterized protein LOC142233350 n=1 Tax=Haematobia irritans TaxID=7368 RepID=UPI003F4FCDC2
MGEKNQKLKLGDKIKELHGIILELKETFRVQNDLFAEGMAQIQVQHAELIKTKKNDDRYKKIFPLQSVEELQDLEANLINKGTEETVLEIVKKIVRNGGLLKNLNNLLGPDIIKAFNYDWFQNKESFKTYNNINQIFFKAIEEEVVTFDAYKMQLKKAFKREKNKIYKEKCLKIKNN